MEEKHGISAGVLPYAFVQYVNSQRTDQIKFRNQPVEKEKMSVSRWLPVHVFVL